MKKSINKRNHGKTIIMHLKRHHRKYLFGAFGWFAIVKMVLLFFWLNSTFNIGNIFASSDEVVLNATNWKRNCDITWVDDGKIICNYSTAHDKYIVGVEPWTFEEYKSWLKYIDLANNKISNIKPWTFDWFTALTELYLKDNQIFDISIDAFSWANTGFTMYINNNCLSDDKIWSLNPIATIEQSLQKVCLYVNYDPQPGNWTNWVVNATLGLTGNTEWISQYILDDETLSFEDNDTPDYFDVTYLYGQQTVLQQEFWDKYDIINLPGEGNEGKFRASVNWIDNNPPKCWTWSYNTTRTNNWINTNVVAKMRNAHDDESWLIPDSDWPTCTIDTDHPKCSITIEDQAWNETECESSKEFKVDTKVPSIVLTGITNDTVDIEISDDAAWLHTNESLRYKWQSETPCTIGNYDSKALHNEEWQLHIMTTIQITNEEWDRYLCVSWVTDRAWNTSDTLVSDVFTINNSKPNCTRESPTKPNLKVWKTGTITLNCTDTEWIMTNSLTSWAIEHDDDIISLSNNAIKANIDGGKSFTFTYTALNSWNTSLVLKAWKIENNIWNTNNRTESENIRVYTEHSSAGDFVEFRNQFISGWAASDSITIAWLGWATWWYDYFDDNNTEIDWENQTYIPISDENISLSFNDYLYNDKYICAFGQIPWYNPQTICTNHKIQIDSENPEVTITSPSNNANFTLWSGVKLKWSGRDNWPSGVYRYTLSIRKPSSPLNPVSFWANITEKDIVLNETWTWHRSVTVYDKALNSWVANWTFYVIASGEPPVITWNLIRFESEVSPTWVQEDFVVINLLQWSTWWYMYFNTGNTEVIDRSGWYRQIPAWWRIELSSENNGEFICAFGSTWWVTQSICSAHPIKIDTTNPNISLGYPSNWSDFKKWVELILTWSWSDNPSGISWYTLTIWDPSWTNYSYDFWNTGTSQSINLDKAWDWYRFVKAYDNADHTVKSNTGYFYVTQSWWMPENWFYLVSPALWEKLNLWDNVELSRRPWLVNNGYKWEIKKISWTKIASWSTNSLNVVVDSWYFTTWAFSWSVTDNYTEITKSIPLFYIIDESDVPDLEVRQFSFDEIENADLDGYYESDIITIKWLSDGWSTLAYLWSGIWSLYINDEFVWISGFVQNGDKVYIEMKASDEYDTTVKTTLFVWVWTDVVSGDFKITTKNGIHNRDDPLLTPMQKLWWLIYVDSLVEMYQYDKEKLATFLSTFMQLLQDKSDYYDKKIQEAEDDWDEELAQEYRLYKEAIDFLYITVKYRYDNLEVEDRTVYIAPNGKQYLVEYDENRMAYTSPDFSRPKYFPTRELFKNHIDLNNPAIWKWWIIWNVITTHNGKVYTIYQTNWKWTSSNFKTAKYFDSKEDIINHILANNPASDWDHKIDTDFDEVKYTAPNGKVYKIFRTSSKWNNPEMYSSYDFVNAKYFTSLEAAKKFIDQNNKK